MSPTKQDDETAKASMTPDFLKEMGISPEEQKEMEDAAYSGAADDIAESAGLSGADLKDAEENPSSPTADTKADPKEGYKAGFGYRDEGQGKSKAKQKASGSFLNRNKKWFMGGGLGAGIAGLVLSLLLLLPLKVQHIVDNLQSHFFASSEKATQDMTDQLFRQYIVKRVIPGMYATKKCTSTKVNKSCALTSPGDGPVAKLYNAWKDKNFEGKLAADQGIEIRREGNKFYMRSDRLQYDIFSGDYDPNNPKAFENKIYSQMDRSEVRREVSKAFENETFAKRVMYRYKVGKLLERKYNIKRCLVACETRDKRADRKAERKELRKLKWKAYFINRIVIPRNEMLGIAFKCAIGGFECTKTDGIDDDGQRTSDFERETRVQLANIPDADIKDLEKTSESIKEKGITEHIIAKMTNDVVAKTATKAIPVIGWVDLAARVRHGLDIAGPSIKKLNYMLNSQTMVTMYMMYRSHADEIKTGQADAADVGIVGDSLGPDNGTDQGGVGAEGAPIYSELMGSSPMKTASIFTAFSPKASAFNGYKCNDGSTIASGVCPEVTLNTINGVSKSIDLISTIGNSQVFAFGAVSADAWLATGGKILDWTGSVAGKVIGGIGGVTLDILKKIPGIGDGIDYITSHASEIASAVGKWFVSKLMNDPIGNSPSGGRNLEIAGGGSDVAGNSFAHYGLGGQEISNQAAAAIRAAQQQEEKDSFMHQSMFARMFSTSSKYSFVSRVAMALPSTTASGVSRSFAGSLLNPFASVASQFNYSHRAGAASAQDPYGVTQYGYSPSDPVFKAQDLQEYWDKNDCGNPDKAKEWGSTAVENSDTGMPENATTNGCKLLETSVQMAGAMFDDSLLPADELGSESISSPTDTTTTESLPASCYTVTKQRGSITEGKMLHKEDNLPINTYAKENSPEGVRYAATHGYDSIDLDIQITKDGVAVNTHWGQPMAKDGFYDPLHKLPDGTQVSDMTLAEVTRLRNHDGQSQINPLTDMIKVLADNHVNLSMELKTGALVKTFPDVTGALNQYKVKAYMKADASKPALNKALTTSRNYGYWTRGTEGSQDWKAPGPNCQ